MFRFTAHNEAHIIMNYNLNQPSDKTEQKISNLASLRKLITLIGEERRNLIIAFAAIIPECRIKLARALSDWIYHR